MPYYDYTRKAKNKSFKNAVSKVIEMQTAPSLQYSFIAPSSNNVTPQYVLTNPVLSVPQIEYKNATANTEDVPTSNTGTMTDKDLNRTYNRGTNTELKLDQVTVKQPKPKINHFNEGFRTYYDDEADVLGVDCCMCCNNCWNKCNNIFRGCRNAISFPVYCWCCFIIPLFFLLISGIIVAVLIGLKVIKTS